MFQPGIFRGDVSFREGTYDPFVYSTCLRTYEYTVDGRTPAPPAMYKSSLNTGTSYQP